MLELLSGRQGAQVQQVSKLKAQSLIWSLAAGQISSLFLSESHLHQTECPFFRRKLSLKGLLTWSTSHS